MNLNSPLVKYCFEPQGFHLKSLSKKKKKNPNLTCSPFYRSYMAHIKVWPHSPHECLLFLSRFHPVMSAIGPTRQQIEAQLRMHTGSRTMWRLQTRAPPPLTQTRSRACPQRSCSEGLCECKMGHIPDGGICVWSAADWPAKACSSTLCPPPHVSPRRCFALSCGEGITPTTAFMPPLFGPLVWSVTYFRVVVGTLICFLH